MSERLGTQLQSGGLEQSIHTGLLGKGMFAGASLDLYFAATKNIGPLVTFTRASSGTYVDSAGVLQTAVTNLLLRSEEFSNAVWAKDFTTATADVAVAPNGATTADKVAEDSSNNFHAISQYVTGFDSGAIVILSVYAKAAGRTRFRIQTDASGGSGTADFDLSAGTATAGTGVLSNGSIINVGDGWYRCSARCTTSGAGAIGLKVILAQSTYGTAYTGDGTSGIYLWGAQLQQSATVGEYIPTTSTINSAPRSDHNPTTGESLGLLVEEQRTNLVLRSEEFDNASWGTLNATVSANTQVAPDGVTSADTLTDVNGVTSANVGCFQSTTLADSTTYAMSCYVKAGTKTTCRVGIRDKAGTTISANFNLATASTTVGNAVSSTIQDAGNGWYRCTAICASLTGATSPRGLVYMDTGSYTANGTGTIHVWGAQLEAGAFPTSYIPTTTAAATRSADVASITGTNFSSWYRQDEGTVYAEYRLPAAGIGIVSIDDGTANNIIPIFTGAAVLQAASANAVVAGASSGRLDSGGSFVANSLNRAAYAIKVADRALSANGATATASATPSAMPVVTQLQIQGQSAFAAFKGGTIKRLTYWPVRLGNNVLQVITQ